MSRRPEHPFNFRALLPVWTSLTTLCLAMQADFLPAANIRVGSAIATGLMESYPSNNMGAVGWYPAGTIQNQACGTTNNPFACRNRGLIKFDIAGAIPPGSAIKSVSFRVWATVQPPNVETDYNNFFDFHRMLVSWGEGSGTNIPMQGIGRPALPGESSWLMRQSPSNTWSIPGGAAGIDYATESSASVYVSMEPGSQSDFPVLAISNRLLADVRFWMDNPGQNFGWITKGQDETARWTAKRFMTVESEIDDYPRLEITFVPPPDMINFQTNSGGVSFEFLAEPEQPYTVQFKDSLTAGDWLTLTNVPAPPDQIVIPVLDSGALTNATRFYRVIAPQ